MPAVTYRTFKQALSLSKTRRKRATKRSRSRRRTQRYTKQKGGMTIPYTSNLSPNASVTKKDLDADIEDPYTLTSAYDSKMEEGV